MRVTVPAQMPSRLVPLTSRIPQVILLEGLVAALADRLGEQASAATALTLEIVSANLAD